VEGPSRHGDVDVEVVRVSHASELRQSLEGHHSVLQG
jgi:hypothetical protein